MIIGDIMFEKCIKCDRLGESCVPNLMLLPFPDLIQWWNKRQKYLEWTNQVLSDKSKVPVGTINRIKAGDYQDCKYSTIKNILIALIGGTTDEFSCTEQVEKELKHLEQLAALEKEMSILRENDQKSIENLLEQVDRLRKEVDYLRIENDRKARIIDKFLDS
jgi:predicted transcriptional regulator